MAKNPDSDKDSSSNPLDLSLLSELSFGPDWASEKGKKRSEQSYRDHDGNDRRPNRPRRQGGGGNRDRRSSFDRNRGGGDNRGRGDSSGERRSFGGGDRRRDFGGRGRNFPPPFEPTVNVIFVSQDKPFEVLLKAMRTTFKTYELFEIAKIILGKENRFIAIVSPKEDAEDKKIYISVPDQLPFETREEAINHVMSKHLDRFFEISEVEVEPPSGNFQMVNRCKLTGELLAPPNFHRYQDILKEHYNNNINNLSWERFLEKVESVKEPEVVQEWIEKMKKTFQYTLKQKEGDGSPKVVLNAVEDVRYYLTTERKNEIFVAKDKFRLPGEKLELMPKSNIRNSVERELENQRRFPLVTSNHLRGRLRRCNLNFFKKGSKGITFVCAVKRKARYLDTVFSESIQALIDFIEAHPKMVVEDLLKEYKPAGVETITEDTQKLVLQDLRWLVGAGYVCEYGNGTLFADKPLQMNAADDKNAQQPAHPKGKKEKKAKAPVAAKPEVAVTEPAEETPAETEVETTEEVVAEATEAVAVEETPAETEVETTEEVVAEVTEAVAVEETPAVTEVETTEEVVAEVTEAVAVEETPVETEVEATEEVVAETTEVEPVAEPTPETVEVETEAEVKEEAVAEPETKAESTEEEATDTEKK